MKIYDECNCHLLPSYKLVCLSFIKKIKSKRSGLMPMKDTIKICYIPNAPTLSYSKLNNDWSLSKCRQIQNVASILPV